MASTRTRVVIDKRDIVNLCLKALTNASRVLDGYDPTNQRADKETLLLWEFSRVLFMRLELGGFGTQDRGAPSLAVDAWQKIIDVLDRRITENPNPNEIVGLIRTYLLEPALNRQSAVIE
jgi:hypothetical protein